MRQTGQPGENNLSPSSGMRNIQQQDMLAFKKMLEQISNDGSSPQPSEPVLQPMHPQQHSTLNLMQMLKNNHGMLAAHHLQQQQQPQQPQQEHAFSHHHHPAKLFPVSKATLSTACARAIPRMRAYYIIPRIKFNTFAVFFVCHINRNHYLIISQRKPSKIF